MSTVLLTLSNALYGGLALALGLYCWFQWRYRDILRVATKLPVTFTAWPLLGHGYFMFWGLEGGTYYILEMLDRAIQRGYKNICFWAGPIPYVVTTDMDDIRLVMNSPKTYEKTEEYESLGEGLSINEGPLKYSLMNAPGPIWKVTRRHMNTMFTPRNLEQMMPVFNNNARVFITRLAQHVGLGPTELDLIHVAVDVSLKTVCDFQFGLDNDIDIDSKAFQDLKRFVESISEPFTKRMLYPWLRPTPLFLFLYKKELAELNKLWTDFTRTPLKATKEKYELKVRKGNLEGDSDGPLTIVEVFRKLQEKNPEFTEIDLWTAVVTWYQTGNDTVANVVCYCLMALAQHPEYQDKAYDEITSVVGQSAEVTIDHINRLTYLEQCINETIRRFNILPILLRKTSEEIELSECTVPAGYPIVFSIYGVHMNPRFYPEPERFDPDRFSPENNASRDKNSFIPFGGGPRDCIGKRYSMMFLKVLLVHFLRQYRVKPAMDIYKLRMKFLVVLTSADGYPVILEER